MLNKDTMIRVVVGVPTVMMGLMAFRWQTTPELSANSLGMPLLEGLGRSAQIGDFSAFFFSVFIFGVLGIVRLKPYWFSAAGILLGSAALFRLLAYLVHGASFAMHFILVELVLSDNYSALIDTNSDCSLDIDDIIDIVSIILDN